MTFTSLYINNSNIHKDRNIPLVRAQIEKHVEEYLIKLIFQPNYLACFMELWSHLSQEEKDYSSELNMIQKLNLVLELLGSKSL